jgi:hypothetical protein
MPSMAHDSLVDLFKNRPSLGAELLSEALGVALPSYTEARLVSIDLTKVRPAEYRAVVVLLLDDVEPCRAGLLSPRGCRGCRLRAPACGRSPRLLDGSNR